MNVTSFLRFRVKLPTPRLIVMLLLIALLQSCASPAQLWLQRGSELGFMHRVLSGSGFTLEAFMHGNPQPGHVLHVYLEGDGLPWASERLIASDPTPRNPLMLRLMALDRSPSVYLGRPCYNGHAEDAGCSPLLWTHRRYAPEVVAAMAEALTGLLRDDPATGLVFIGYSGGGALALLLAPRFASTGAVVTLAGNADIDVWADLHGFSRLAGSLNPAKVSGGKYPEFHFLGEMDKVIPPAVFLPVLKKRPYANIIVLPGLDHVCCWEQRWPDILNHLPNASARR